MTAEIIFWIIAYCITAIVGFLIMFPIMFHKFISICPNCFRPKWGKYRSVPHQFGYGSNYKFTCKRCNESWEKDYWGAF